MTHSKTIEETKLWQLYLKKTDDITRLGWTKIAYSSACNQLKAVRDTFKNYTLHDETHVLNVMDAMAGLLGNRINELTVGEVELLILVSAFHDLGMVYTDDERKNCLSDSDKLRDYYSSNPDMRGKDVEDWDEFEQQDYLRWLHPCRIDDVLQQSYWVNFFENKPQEMAPMNVIAAVCKAHGETPEIILRKATEPRGILKYISNRDVDPLFCAILLRLADILDFDDSRAPAVLFSYSGKNIKSVEEWKKHISSMGFNYPNVPSSKELPYGACFTDPTIERTANVFIDWIDEELSNSRSLISHTNERWNHFVFPYQVNRSEIERVGYDFGDFKITMDQDRIMELLVGEDIYSDTSVFVRELLQNSIDATLTRAEMDSTFAEKIDTDEARIDLWEWWDEKGDLWFRIDDFGIGMTRGMLERYFLKAGNSYYNSQEFKRDLNGKSFNSISRFGIGFLSCFLCGVEAYVSTKYWNPEKNIREAERDALMRIEQNAFGLRLDVVGVNGYYTLKNQAYFDNRPSPLPAPPITCPHPDCSLENNGYRVSPGTSIAIRIEPGKLGATSLEKAARKWVCNPNMPVYFNGKRLCMTNDEIMALAKAEKGVFEYELSDEEKLRVDSLIPKSQGYPKIVETIDLFDATKISGLAELKIIFLETKVLFPVGSGSSVLNFDIKRHYRDYTFNGNCYIHRPEITIHKLGDYKRDAILSFHSRDNRRLMKMFSDREEMLSLNYGWKGIVAFRGYSNFIDKSFISIVLDENEKRPNFGVDRESIDGIPLLTGLTINVWLTKKYPEYFYSFYSLSDPISKPLKEWRAIISSSFGGWIDVTSWNKYQDFKLALEKGVSSEKDLPLFLRSYTTRTTYRNNNTSYSYLLGYFIAYMQLHYKVVVNYTHNKLVFNEIDTSEPDDQFDLFPPFLFCYGETSEDSSILCLADPALRITITANHPFTIWLKKYAEKIHQHYPRQFNQIINIIGFDEPDDFINNINELIKQLSNTAYRYGIDTSDCPKLTLKDFKEIEDNGINLSE